TFSYLDIKDSLCWGSWVYPIWPRITTTTGNDQFGIDYTWNDYVSCEDVVSAFEFWANMAIDERCERGETGRKWAMKNYSRDRMSNGIQRALDRCPSLR